MLEPTAAEIQLQTPHLAGRRDDAHLIEARRPKQVDTDVRFSRFLTFTERYRAEVFGEFVNVFNKKSIFSVNSTVTTDAAGALTAALPDFTTRSPTALDARIFQLGFKFNF